MRDQELRIDETLTHLRALVSFDTCNPPREMTGDAGIFAYLAANLAGFEVEVVDHGEGCVSLLATRGTPTVLINCHVDTVPVAKTWREDPHVLRVESGRAIGLGACDIKGAAAALLCAAAHTKGDIALLFTSDEEAGQGKCVKAFLERGLAYEVVLVCEPTSCLAVLEHRGIVTGTATFHGVAGHASLPRALEDSAVHEAVRWSSQALAWAHRRREEDVYQSLAGTSLNLGRFEGGTKPNMVAAEAMIRFGMRPLPSHDSEALLTELKSLATDPWRVTWTPGFYGPTLPARGADGRPGAARAQLARAKAQALGLPSGEAVNFWTEAALFSAAGHDAVVFGPGDIAQAHTGGEFVELHQLDEACKIYETIMGEA